MKISLNWLRDFVDISSDDETTLIDKLTVITSELEGVENMGQNHSDVVVGEILSVEKHPDSIKLHLLKVNVGDEILDIVCGAPNVAVGLKVPVVRVGGMVSGQKIKQAKVAGYMSNGMCCGGEELGIETHSDGLLILPVDTKIGADVIELLKLKDTILEIDNKSLTNRPDLWGHYGFAREVSAILNKPLKKMDLDNLHNYDLLPKVNVKVKDKTCLRYSAIKIENINEKESPIFVKTRLMYCGLRPINLLADLTNYVMLETSQPLHAFDGRNVSGIVVKKAEHETKFTTLDGNEHKLNSETTLICDEKENPVAVAGVMGGLNSEIKDDTKSVLLESACFRSGDIRKTAISIGTRTDASNRYEKSLDPENCEIATARYIKLLKSTCPDVKVVSQYTDVYNIKYPKIVIKVSHEEIEKYLGQAISKKEVKDILTRLDFVVLNDNYDVEVPSFRATKDISISADLIEEIARMYGYENIESKPYITSIVPTEPNIYHEDSYNTKQILATSLKYNEVNSYIYKNKNFIKEYNLPDKENVKILGALSPENSELRNNLVYTLLEMSFENIKNFDEVNIFEIANCFDGLDDKKMVIEKKHLCLVKASVTKNETELYKELAKDLKFLVKSLKNVDINFEKTNNKISNPKMCNNVIINNEIIGQIASIHPKITFAFDKKLVVAYCELDMELLSKIQQKIIKYEMVSKYPSIDIDISFLVDKNMPYEEIKNAITEKQNRLLQNVKLIEVYKSDALKDKKSITIRFTLCSINRTLTTEEVKAFTDRMTADLKQHNIVPRY